MTVHQDALVGNPIDSILASFGTPAIRNNKATVPLPIDLDMAAGKALAS